MITVQPETPFWTCDRDVDKSRNTWCRVCGEVIWLQKHRRPEDQRCHKHYWSNPCAVEGCKRSRKAPEWTPEPGRIARYLSLDWWLCTEHWRLGCPPHTAERRVIRRLWRLMKEEGRSDADQISRREDRIWDAIISRARARARGDIDMDEIKRVMGW